MNTAIARRERILAGKQVNNIQRLKTKAALWDEFMEFVEDKHFGLLMRSAEKEKNIPLQKTKKALR